MTNLKPHPTPITQPQTLRFVDSWASIDMDIVRATAAFLVLLAHWRNIFFVDYPQLANHKILWIVPYVLTDAGHQAVIVFFVLSGFFVGGSVLRAIESNQWNWREYLLRRSVRLWIVLFPALLACLFWDKLGLSLGFAPALYHGGVPNHLVQDVSQLLSPRLFLINLFFLQNTYGYAFGSDGALWSLASEFWYYLLFPLGLLAILPSAHTSRRLLWLGLFVLTAWFVGLGVLWSFPIWLAGVLLLRIPPLRLSTASARRLRIVAPLVYAPLFFYLAKSSILSSVASDYVLTGFTFLFLRILLSATARHPLHTVPVRTSRAFARCSYTLYAVHTPLLVFMASLLVHEARWQPTPIHVVTGLSVLIAASAYSFGIAWLTEFRTDAVRVWLEHALRISPTSTNLPSNPAADAP